MSLREMAAQIGRSRQSLKTFVRDARRNKSLQLPYYADPNWRPEEMAFLRAKIRTQVAVARRLAVIMHRMWVDGTPFQWSRNGVDEAAPA